jgi:hypothetical protein
MRPAGVANAGVGDGVEPQPYVGELGAKVGMLAVLLCLFCEEYWRNMLLLLLGLLVGLVLLLLSRLSPKQPMPEWADAALALLPSVPAAQRTHVVRRRQLLSSSEVDQLEEVANTLVPSCGRAVRDRQDMLQSSGGSGPWETTYLSTGGQCYREPKVAMILKRLLREARAVDAEEGWNLLGNPDSAASPPCPVRWRNVEYHVVRPGGSLSDPKHFDPGSLVTVDVMLADTGDFEGGRFSTLEVVAGCHPDTTTPSGVVEEHKVHEFERGDAVFFVSHKRHTVSPVVKGERRVLVAELWHGPQRECAHRCMHRVGDCDFDFATSQRPMSRLASWYHHALEWLVAEPELKPAAEMQCALPPPPPRRRHPQELRPAQ